MSSPPFYPFIDEHPRRRRTIYYISAVALVLLLVGLNILAISYFSREGERSRESVAAYNVVVADDGQFAKSASGGLAMEISVLDVDPLRNIVKFNTKVLLDPSNRAASIGNGSLLLGSFKPVPINAANVLFVEQDVTETSSGDASRYPFDKYTVSVPFAATKSSVLANPNATSIPWGALAYSPIQSFRFTFNFRVDLALSPIGHLDITIKRSPTTKGFAIFTVTIMWVLTLLAMLVTTQVMMRRREVQPALISAFIALLFALPSIRNTWPMAPPIGTLLDTVSLFWNMSLVGLCAAGLLVMWVLQGPSVAARQAQHTPLPSDAMKSFPEDANLGQDKPSVIESHPLYAGYA